MPTCGAQMQVELKSLQREVGIAFVFVTHDQEEAMVMSDRIALLRSGELEQVATPREIYSQPATRLCGAIHRAYQPAERRGPRRNRALLFAGVAGCNSLTGASLFSLRPETYRRERFGRMAVPAVVRFRGRISTRLSRGYRIAELECADGLTLSRGRAAAAERRTTGLEFSAADAVPVRESPGKRLMFSRAYKTAVTVPPLLWVAVFLLVPYLLMFCYSFWSVTPSQTIVHTWTCDNYANCCSVHVYWQTLLRSMRIAARVTLFSLLLGYPLAYFVSFYAGRGRICSINW